MQSSEHNQIYSKSDRMRGGQGPAPLQGSSPEAPAYCLSPVQDSAESRLQLAVSSQIQDIAIAVQKLLHEKDPQHASIDTNVYLQKTSNCVFTFVCRIVILGWIRKGFVVRH